MDKIQKINKEYYDKNAELWSASKTNSFYQEEPFRKFVKYLKMGNSVLDIGCSHGVHVPLFLGIGRDLKYEGLDISKKFLSISISRYPQLKFIYGDISDKKTLPNKKYDAFWAAMVLMHIPEENWSAMLDNLERLVKNGGIGYLTLPKERPYPESKIDRRHFNLFDNKKFLRIAKERKWKILNSGKLLSSNKKTEWLWYIIRLPK